MFLNPPIFINWLVVCHIVTNPTNYHTKTLDDMVANMSQNEVLNNIQLPEIIHMKANFLLSFWRFFEKLWLACLEPLTDGIALRITSHGYCLSYSIHLMLTVINILKTVASHYEFEMEFKMCKATCTLTLWQLFGLCDLVSQW